MIIVIDTGSLAPFAIALGGVGAWFQYIHMLAWSLIYIEPYIKENLLL